MINEITLKVDKPEIEAAIRKHFEREVELPFHDFEMETSDLNQPEIQIIFKRHEAKVISLANNPLNPLNALNPLKGV